MKLEIAVCDDVQSDLERVAGYLEKICGGMEVTPHIDLFASGEDFLAAAEKHVYDVVFMDIFLDGITGIDAARHCKNKGCRFVFITVSTDFAVEAYSLNAAHYLIKPVTYENTAEALQRCVTYLKRPVKTLNLRSRRKTIPVPMENISYIEVKDKVCEVHTEEKIYRAYISLNALSEQLDGEMFARVQQSFAVNMGHIEEFYHDSVRLRDGTEIAISRAQRGKLKEQYQNYLFRIARRNDI